MTWVAGREDRVTGRRAALAVAVLFVTNGALFASLVTRIPAIRDQVSAGPAELGYALFSLAAGSLVAMQLTGRACRRWGSARVSRVAVSSGALVLPLVGLVPSPPLLGLALFLLGLAYGPWDVAMNVQGHRAEQVAGRAYLPRLHAAWSAGTLTFSALGALAAGEHVPVVAHLAVLSVVTLASTLSVTRYFLDDSDPAPGIRKPRSHRRFDWRLALLGVMTLCGVVGEGSAADWLALFLVDERGAGPGVGAAGFTTFAVAMMLGRAAGTPVLERLGRVRTLRLSGLLIAVGVTVTVTSPGLPVAFVGCAIWGLGAAVVFPTAMSAAGGSSNRPADAIALVSTIGYGGFLVGPPLVGTLAEQVGLTRALAAVAVLGLGVSACASFARVRRPEREPPTAAG